MQKIIFLDIDGVLCISMSDDLFDKSCCKNLKEILEATDAKIVISSSWRQSEDGIRDIKLNLEANGISGDVIIWQTPDFSIHKRCRTEQEFVEQRWEEISDYIAKNNITAYVIIDDMDFGGCAAKNFVKTDMCSGLTERLKNRCIRILQCNTTR